MSKKTSSTSYAIQPENKEAKTDSSDWPLLLKVSPFHSHISTYRTTTNSKYVPIISLQSTQATPQHNVQ